MTGGPIEMAFVWCLTQYATQPSPSVQVKSAHHPCLPPQVLPMVCLSFVFLPSHPFLDPDPNENQTRKQYQ